jgi:hypothetical protein
MGAAKRRRSNIESLTVARMNTRQTSNFIESLVA